MHFPDHPMMPDGRTPHYKPSDRRNALMPALAARALEAAGEEWDWMLVGDGEGARREVAAEDGWCAVEWMA